MSTQRRPLRPEGGGRDGSGLAWGGVTAETARRNVVELRFWDNEGGLVPHHVPATFSRCRHSLQLPSDAVGLVTKVLEALGGRRHYTEAEARVEAVVQRCAAGNTCCSCTLRSVLWGKLSATWSEEQQLRLPTTSHLAGPQSASLDFPFCSVEYSRSVPSIPGESNPRFAPSEHYVVSTTAPGALIPTVAAGGQKNKATPLYRNRACYITSPSDVLDCRPQWSLDNPAKILILSTLN